MDLLRVVNGTYKGHDAYTDNLFLMDNPIKICIIIFAYLVFIFKIGPKFMENRKAFVLREILMIYNLFQIFFSLYVGFALVRSNKIIGTLVNPDCSVTRDRQSQIEKYHLGYCYTIAKLIDLLDTVFFVLRKKTNQITFLHLYHHVIMSLSSWAFLKYNPSEEFMPGGILNSFVHVLMYSYYLMASQGPQYKKYLWWKKYMTTVQMVQFLLVIIYLLALVLRGCSVSKTVQYFTISNLLLLLYLFYDFYRKSYGHFLDHERDIRTQST